MTKYYLEVLVDNLSICVDSDVQYYHQFKVGDVIPIHMYSDKGPKVVFGSTEYDRSVEYDAQFTLDWDKRMSARLTVAACIAKGYMVDVTKNIHRDEKLEQLGI
jgi:hypothetical protein